tara:strand:+ start:936 stop:1193 length:258 start_codon:yes stop_codon:yes gene_type:complete
MPSLWGHPFFCVLFNNVETLDLHGVRHEDAEYKIHKFIYRVALPCKIITGHSTAMKKIVREVLEEYALHSHYENYVNNGCLVVTD